MHVLPRVLSAVMSACGSFVAPSLCTCALAFARPRGLEATKDVEGNNAANSPPTRRVGIEEKNEKQRPSPRHIIRADFFGVFCVACRRAVLSLPRAVSAQLRAAARLSMWGTVPRPRREGRTNAWTGVDGRVAAQNIE